MNTFILILTLITSSGTSVTHVPISNHGACRDAAKVWLQSVTSSDSAAIGAVRAHTNCVPA